METHKSIAIRIPIDVYNRVEQLCPMKKWGRNDIRDFWTKIFLEGVESPYFLKLETRRLTTKLQVTESLLRSQPKGIHAASLTEALAKQVEACQDACVRQPEAEHGVETGPSSQERASTVVLTDERKSSVH